MNVSHCFTMKNNLLLTIVIGVLALYPIAFTVWLVSPLLASANDTVAFLTMLGTLIGGIATPFAILIAYQMHRQSIEEPRAVQERQANDFVWATIASVPTTISIGLSEAYKVFLLDSTLEDPDTVREMTFYLGVAAKNVEYMMSQLAAMQELMAHLAHVPRLRLWEAMSVFVSVESRVEVETSFHNIQVTVSRLELALGNIIMCRDEILPPDEVNFLIENEPRLYGQMNTLRREFYRIVRERDDFADWDYWDIPPFGSKQVHQKS